MEIPRREGDRPAGERVEWIAVPQHVRQAIEAIAGARVATALTQPHGFSPSLAARCVLANGKRVFVKAVGVDVNPDTPAMHRQEIVIQAGLPPAISAPRLLGSWDDDHWVALVFEDLDGRHPRVPWQREELAQVVSDLAGLAERLTPNPVVNAPSVIEEHTSDFDGYRQLALAPPTDLDPWTARNLDRLADLESGWEAAATGPTLAHGDVRGDNILLTGSGPLLRSYFVDWPAACVTVPWFDIVMMAPSVVLEGGPDPDTLLTLHPAARTVDRDQLIPLVAAFAGYLADRSRRPAPASMPTVRAFQAAQGRVAREWLRDLAGLP